MCAILRYKRTLRQGGSAVIEFLQNSNWELAREHLLRGEPPLITQLLVFNTVIFIVWALRRMRGGRAIRYKTAVTVQAMLVAANCFLLMNGELDFVDFSRITDMFS